MENINWILTMINGEMMVEVLLLVFCTEGFTTIPGYLQDCSLNIMDPICYLTIVTLFVYNLIINSTENNKRN